MSFQTIVDKKFLDADGTGHLWEKIKERYDAKLDSLTPVDDSILVSNGNEIQVQISNESGNLLQLISSGNNKGLYVSSTGDPDTYAIVRSANAGEYAAKYQMMKYIGGTGNGVQVGVDINIPKDMVVQSGTVETKSTSGAWGQPGTYIHLVLANASSSDIYVPVDSLIEYVTSGSQLGDMVIISIDPSTHVVTATLGDDSITASKLDPALRSSIAAAAAAVQIITTGTTNGTINVDGTDVAVAGLGTAAFANTSAFDPAGSAAAVLGDDGDYASTATVYGVKQYASDAYAAIKPLTNAEIDAAILAAST